MISPAAALTCVLLLLASSEGRASDASIAYCGIYSREAVRIDIMHTAPVSASVTDAYIEAMAVQVFKQCISILPALLPLPEAHRNLGSWVKDMQRMLISRSGTEPAGDAPERAQGDEDDEAWREACRVEYRTWNEADGTVIRNGNPERVRCPLVLVDGAWGIPE